MNILSGKFKLAVERPAAFSVIWIIVLRSVRWLRWFSTLTEEDQQAAGITINHKDHDD